MIPNMTDNQAPEQEITVNPKDCVFIEMSGDYMKVYVKFVRPEAGEYKPAKEDVMEALAEQKIVYGINEEAIDKLIARPVYNLKIQIGEGTPAIDGADGCVDYFVVTDDEYRPEISEEGDVDFKNLEYFQMVKEGQMLAAMRPPEEGTPGRNVLGNEIAARPGKEAKSPQGKNTSFNEDGSVLFSNCDGIVSFVGETVNINDVMHISGDVDSSTGNINFSGDVIVEGNVCEGFEIHAGGNVLIKGHAESCIVETGGDMQIARGINGDDDTRINVAGSFHALYVEHSNLTVKGDIFAESIIDSNVTCEGNIDLSNSGKGVLIGGTTNIKGELVVRNLGNDNERVTTVNIMGIENSKEADLMKMRNDKDECVKNLERLRNEKKKLNFALLDGEDAAAEAKAKELDMRMNLIQSKIEEYTEKIAAAKEKWSVEYIGCVICKSRLYYGSRIYFGEQRFQFDSDYLDCCRIMWSEGEILNVTL